MGVPPRGTPKYKKWLTQQKRRKREVRLEAAKAKARKPLKNAIEQLRSEVEAVTRRYNKHFRHSGYFEAAVAAARLENCLLAICKIVRLQYYIPWGGL